MLFNPGWSTDKVNVDPTCWRSGLSDWKMYGLHINVTTNLWRNDSSLLILFNVPLVILPPLSYKQPLNISRKWSANNVGRMFCGNNSKCYQKTHTVKPIINVKNKQYQTFFMPVTTTVQTITRENTECMTQKNSLC